MVRSAIIGYGGMGSWHHDSIKEKVPGIQVAGAYDVRQEALEKAASKGLRTYSSLEDLLADSSIDLVTVATPNNFHKDLVIRCLESGKHVVCEKPVAMNAAELKEMMAAAKRANRLFSVHQNRRWDKDYVIIKKLIQENTLGRPYYIESRVQGSGGGMHGWRGHKINGGGMLYDWGVHLLDQLMDAIHSPVVSVTAHQVSLFSDEIDDNVKLLIRFENGISALCAMETNCFIPLPRWHMCCENGTVVVEGWSAKGEIVQLAEGGKMEWTDEIVYTEAGPTRTMAPRPVNTTKHSPLPEVHTDWSDYYGNIVAVLEGREELIVKPEQALRVMKVIDLAFESQKQGVGLACHI